MKNKAVLALVFVFYSVLALGVCCGADFSVQEVLDNISRRQKGLYSLECGFLQKRFFAQMEEEVIFDGKIYYKSPNKVRWEYLHPDVSTMVVNGNVAQMEVPELEQIDTYRVSENPRIETFLSFFARGFERFSDFKSRITGTRDGAQGKVLTVELLPTGKDGFYKRVEFDVLTASWQVVRVVVEDVSGDITDTALDGVKTNVKMDSDMFVLVAAKPKDGN